MVAAAAYLQTQNTDPQAPADEQKTDASGWETYQNKNASYEVSYPDTWGFRSNLPQWNVPDDYVIYTKGIGEDAARISNKTCYVDLNPTATEFLVLYENENTAIPTRYVVESISNEPLIANGVGGSLEKYRFNQDTALQAGSATFTKGAKTVSLLYVSHSSLPDEICMSAINKIFATFRFIN